MMWKITNKLRDLSKVAGQLVEVFENKPKSLLRVPEWAYKEIEKLSLPVFNLAWMLTESQHADEERPQTLGEYFLFVKDRMAFPLIHVYMYGIQKATYIKEITFRTHSSRTMSLEDLMRCLGISCSTAQPPICPMDIQKKDTSFA